MIGWLAQLPDIEDIALPEPVKSPWPLIIGIVITVVILSVAVWVVVYFLRQDANRKAPEMPPHRRALRELEQLEAQRDELSPNQFSQSVSLTLEVYLESQFSDRYRYETSEELIQRLATTASSQVPMSKRQQLVDFAVIAEEIKFGLPPDAEARKLPLLEQARAIVTT